MARAERRAGEAIGVQALFGDLDSESRRNLGTRLRGLGRLRRTEEELHEVHEDVGDHHGGEQRLHGDEGLDHRERRNGVAGSVESLQLASIFSTYPAASLSIWHAALVEVVITSMLMGMIMALTDDGNGVPKGPLAPLLIGILVAVIGASTGPLTGFAMNPARDFGPKLFTWFAGWGNIAMTGGRDIPYFIVPIIAPLLGACLGAAIYRFLIANNLPCHTCVEEENTR